MPVDDTRHNSANPPHFLADGGLAEELQIHDDRKKSPHPHPLPTNLCGGERRFRVADSE